ncbi:MAG: dienelactone hydrolase family protein [Pseudomonadota bacterium]|nr:dienelactone hydrolase family protein [Pseudomonadota bacterium]
MRVSKRFARASQPGAPGVAALRKLAILSSLVAALLGSASPAQAATGERVSFDSLDIDPETGQPVTISALYFRPAADASNKLPAVVALHGCGGMYRTLPARRDRLTERHQAMADLLVAEGYAVLFPDSFNPRGRREVCSLEIREQWITQDHRRLDVLAALGYLRARPDIDGSRVALLGWSHGGSAVLATMNRRHPVVIQFLAAQDRADVFYRTAIAFYPGCFASLRTRFGYAPAAPVSLFIGEADDWTSPKPCVSLGEKMAADNEPLQVRSYPDTYHGFDAPNMTHPLHLDVPTGVYPGQGVTIAPNRAARDDAYARMKEQLRAALAR